MKIVFIGTSDTAGIPVHFCKCTACEKYRENNKYNSPTCAYIEFNDGLIFIDSGSDELIKIRENKKVLAHFLTHFHGDHAYGLLRLRHTKTKIPCYHPNDKIGFADLYKKPQGLIFIENVPFKTILVKNTEITPLPLLHSRPTNGYLIKTANKTIVYLTDCSGLKKETYLYLKNINIDAIFLDASYSEGYNKGKHLNYLEANELIENIGAKEGFLIHQSHHSLSSVLNNKIDLKYKYIPEGFEYTL